MKTNIFKNISILAILLTVGVGNVLGAVTSPITLTTNNTTLGYSSGTVELTNKFDYKLTFSSVSGGSTSGYIQNAKNSNIFNTVAIPGAITSIKLTDCATTSAKTDGSFTIYGGTSQAGCTNEIEEVTGLSSTAADKTVNFDEADNYTYFKITVGSARVLKISSIVISFSTGGGSGVDLTFSVPSGVTQPSTQKSSLSLPTPTGSPTNCGDCWAFAGWTTSTNSTYSGSSAPTPLYAAGSTQSFASDATLYAVYKKEEYQAIKSTSGLEANDYYVIVSQPGSTRQALSNTAHSYYAYDAAATDVSSYAHEDAEGYYLYNVPSDVIWKFTGSSSSGQLQNVGNTSKYLNLSSQSASILNSTNNLTFAVSGYQWTISSTYYLGGYSIDSYGYGFDAASSEDFTNSRNHPYLYHRTSSTYATSPGCSSYDIVWMKDGSEYDAGSPTGTTNTCIGIETLPTPPADNTISTCANVFMGWSETSSSAGGSEPADLFIDASDAPRIDEDKTFYAVFASMDTESPTKTQTLQYDSWEYGGTTTDKTSYRLFGNGSYIVSEAFDLRTLAKVIVYGGTFGGDSYNSISINDGSNTWKNVTVSGKSETGTNEYTGGSTLRGWGHLYIESKSGNGTSTGVRISKVEIYTYPVEDYRTSCCTELASLNGSISYTNPSTAVLTWDKLSNVAASNPYTISYRTGSAAYGTSNVGAVDLTGSKATCTITGLSCNTDYDFKIEVTAASSYCDKDSVMEDKNSGKYAITLTDGGEPTGGMFAVTDGDNDLTEACDGDVLYLAAIAADGYQFDNWEITYTSGGADAWDEVEDTGDATDDEIIINMPAADITVNAVFSCVSTTATVDATSAAGNYGWRYTPGETIDLTCSVSGATPTGYQWQKYVGSEWTDINKATNASAGTARLQIASCTSSDGGSYRCVVTTGTGCSFLSDGGDGYFVRIFTLDGNYSGSDWTKNAITWTGEKTGTVTLNLNESSIYMFKVTDNDGKWFGNGTNNYIIQPVNWNCYTGNSDMRLFTGPEGNYTFTLDITNAGAGSPYVNVQVAYPSVTHPAEGYAYVSKWWTCYPHFWDGSGNALTPDGYDPELTTYTTICGDPYWYFPVLATYVNVIVKDNATYASASNKSDNQTTTNHSGMYLTHDGSWGWHDFEKYTISFAGNGNSGGSMSDVSNICPDDNRTLAENGYTKTGYHFDGWKTNVAVTINTGGDDTNIPENGIVADEATIKGISSDITLTAQWAANTNTPYLVKHYKQNLDGSYPSTPTETDELTGTSDASITPERKSYTGFTAPAGTTTTISADGSLVVTYNYTRNSYALTWSTDGDALTGDYTKGTIKYGASITAPNTPTKTGYTFAGWHDGSSVVSPATTMPAAATTYTATWTVNSHTLAWDWNGGSCSGTAGTHYTAGGSLNFGTSISYPDDSYMSKTGYTFTGWSSDATTMPDGNLTITAQWSINQYNVSVTELSTVTISAGDIDEGENDDVNYGTELTLSYSAVTSGHYWSGWKVTKQSDGTDVTASVVAGSTLTVPDYDITVSAKIYGDVKAWCVPTFNVTGDVHLTSTAGVYVNLSEAADNLINFSGSDLYSVSKITINYLDGNGDEVAAGSSPLRLYGSAGTSLAEGNITSFTEGAYNQDYSVRLTVPAETYNTEYNYKLLLKIYKGTRVIKTVEHPMNGRALPEEFVIAVKSGDQWYALPNNLASTSSQPSIVPLKISVDNSSAPTAATYAPTTAAYKATGRNAATKYMNGIRFTTTTPSTNWLQTAKGDGTYNMWLSTTNSDSAQVWYLSSSDFGAYTLKMDAKHNGSKKMGIYTGGYMGFHSSPSASDIYFLPITNKYTEIAATVSEWGQNSVVLAANPGASANKAQAHIDDGSPTEKQDITAINGVLGTAKNVKVPLGDIDLDVSEGNEGKLLYIDWYNGSTLLGTSCVTIPRIVAEDRTANKTNDTDKKVWNTEVHVLPGATLTIDGESFKTGVINSTVSVNELQVYPGATINVSTGTLAASTLRLRNGWTRAGDKKYDVARVYIADDAALTKGTASMDYNIYELADGQHFYPLAVPFPVAVSAIDYADSWLAGFSSYGMDGQYVIKEYNGARRAEKGPDQANNWTPLAEGATLSPGKGYIMAAVPVKGEAIIRVPLTFDNGWTSDGEKASYDDVTKNVVAVKAYEGAATAGDKKVNKGWNLLGVPFMSCYGTSADMGTDGVVMQGKFDFKTGEWKEEDVRYVNVPVHDFSEYIQVDMEDDDPVTVLRPGWCFFVQVEKDGDLTFLTADQAASSSLPIYAPKRGVKADMPTVKTGIILSDGEKSDKTTFLVSDKYNGAEYEINADLEKMFGNGYTLATYSLSGATRLAYNALSNADAANIIPIGYRAPVDGEYTFAINPRYAQSGAFEQVNLIDYETGSVTDLLQYSYTFSTGRTQNDTRFALNVVKQKETPTGIENGANGANDANGVRKLMIDGKVYIIRSGQMYDATGKKVKGGAQ